MNTLPRRWAPHVCVLLGITMLPVVLHGYVGVESDDCAHATAIAPLWAPGDAPTGRAAYIDERMKPEQWREGILRESDGTALSYTIGRGFDAKHLYYRPEYKLLRVARPSSHEIVWIEVGEERVPVHRPLYERNFSSPMIGVAAYVILYNGVPVENPYRAQLLWAPLQIVRGRLPTTLLFVWGLVPETEVAAAEARAYDWLRSAVRNYREICAPRTGEPIA